jgi:hypothetical protein
MKNCLKLCCHREVRVFVSLERKTILSGLSIMLHNISLVISILHRFFSSASAPRQGDYLVVKLWLPRTHRFFAEIAAGYQKTMQRDIAPVPYDCALVSFTMQLPLVCIRAHVCVDHVWLDRKDFCWQKTRW